MAEPASVRIDRFLFAARCFKSRSDSQAACSAGHVKLNGASVKPSHPVRVGDEIQARAPRGEVVWRVLVLSERRLPPSLARALYEDHSPPPPPKEERFAVRDHGAGRPTKADRRALRRLRGDY